MNTALLSSCGNVQRYSAVSLRCLIHLPPEQLQQENICEDLEKGVYTIDMFTKRNASLTKKINQLQSAEADLLRQQNDGSKKSQTSAQIIPMTQHILESYPLLTVEEKNRLWKLVLKKATIYCSPDDEVVIRIYPNLPK